MLRLALLAALLLLTLAASEAAVAGADIGPRPVAPSDCVPVPAATPADGTSPNSMATPFAPPLADVEEIEERDFPPGDDAEPETVAAIFTLERQYAACLNVGDYRALELLFDPALREEFAEAFDQLANPVATPDVPDDAWLIESVALRCVRTYPGGYAAALLDWSDSDGAIETNARVYHDSSVGWRIFDEVTAYGVQGEGCDAG